MSTSTNTVLLALGVGEAFALISDPALYPRWLVGAQAIRRIDAGWPAVGTKFEHRIGVGPLAIPGSTTVRQIDAPYVLELAAGMGALGESKVRFELVSAAGGTQLSIIEVPRKGVAALASKLMSPLVQGALWGRNHVSLVDLARIAEEMGGERRRATEATVDAGGDVVGSVASGDPLVEGPNSY